MPRSFAEALPFYENNIAKMILLLRSMISHNVKRFIFASSRSVYGDSSSARIKETDPKNPLSPYARTKLITEIILQDVHRATGLEYMAIRFVNAVGASPELGLGEDHNPETHIFPLLLRAGKYHRPFTIYGTNHATEDGTCVRSYIHVMDIARANYMAFEYLKRGGPSDIVNLGSEARYSIYGLIKAVENFYHTTVELNILPKREADSPELVTDYSKATRLFGWEPMYSTIDYILKSMDDYENTRVSTKFTSDYENLS